jgi:hypothetical protein
MHTRELRATHALERRFGTRGEPSKSKRHDAIRTPRGGCRRVNGMARGAVHDSLQVVAVWGEGVCHGLAHYNQGAAGRECPPDRMEDLDGSRLVVHALESERHVDGPLRQGGGVLAHEAHPLAGTSGAGVRHG